MAMNHFIISTLTCLLVLIPTSAAPHRERHVEVTDDDVESEQSLIALYKKWLSVYRTQDEYFGSTDYDWEGENTLFKRYSIFKNNVMFIHAANKRGNVTYTLGLNKFADLSNEDFRATYTRPFQNKGVRKERGVTTQSLSGENGSQSLPSAVDWRKSEAVTGKDAPLVVIDGYEDVPANNEDALMKAVSHQPVSVAIEAGGLYFQFYSKGVFSGSCGTDLDHGVAIVGYGKTSEGDKHWIVKNSWGTDWGDGGYIKMKRTNGEGLCGINKLASFPVKVSTNPSLEESDSLINLHLGRKSRQSSINMAKIK
ncbi:hypothetical protein Scep_018084 [Stephania cephalantha]|uniref:Cysteine protease n=1 Tax=Stephania cephalantha TaxID=152367 RepID=A0AAP0IQT0_9MAGN